MGLLSRLFRHSRTPDKPVPVPDAVAEIVSELSREGADAGSYYSHLIDCLQSGMVRAGRDSSGGLRFSLTDYGSTRLAEAEDDCS